MNWGSLFEWLRREYGAIGLGLYVIRDPKGPEGDVNPQHSAVKGDSTANDGAPVATNGAELPASPANRRGDASNAQGSIHNLLFRQASSLSAQLERHARCQKCPKSRSGERCRIDLGHVAARRSGGAKDATLGKSSKVFGKTSVSDNLWLKKIHQPSTHCTSVQAQASGSSGLTAMEPERKVAKQLSSSGKDGRTGEGQRRRNSDVRRRGSLLSMAFNSSKAPGGKARASAISSSGGSWTSYVITHPPVAQPITENDCVFVVIPPDVLEDKRLCVLDMLLPLSQSEKGVRRFKSPPPSQSHKSSRISSPPTGASADSGPRPARGSSPPLVEQMDEAALRRENARLREALLAERQRGDHLHKLLLEQPGIASGP